MSEMFSSVHIKHPPESDVPGQGLGDGGPPDGDGDYKSDGDGPPPELDADEQLRDDDSDHHPALSTQFAAFGVVQKFKGFAQRNLTKWFFDKDYKNG